MDIDLSTQEEVEFRFTQICAYFAIQVRDNKEPKSTYEELYSIADALREKYCKGDVRRPGMIDIKVKTKQREYEFHDAKSWIVDGLFLTVESQNGDKRFIKTDDIEDILVKNVEDEDE